MRCCRALITVYCQQVLFLRFSHLCLKKNVQIPLSCADPGVVGGPDPFPVPGGNIKMLYFAFGPSPPPPPPRIRKRVEPQTVETDQDFGVTTNGPVCKIRRGIYFLDSLVNKLDKICDFFRNNLNFKTFEYFRLFTLIVFYFYILLISVTKSNQLGYFSISPAVEELLCMTLWGVTWGYFWGFGCASQLFETYPNHILGLRKK